MVLPTVLLLVVLGLWLTPLRSSLILSTSLRLAVRRRINAKPGLGCLGGNLDPATFCGYCVGW
jgi:hypothetical protein